MTERAARGSSSTGFAVADDMERPDCDAMFQSSPIVVAIAAAPNATDNSARTASRNGDRRAAGGRGAEGATGFFTIPSGPARLRAAGPLLACHRRAADPGGQTRRTHHGSRPPLPVRHPALAPGRRAHLG